MATVPRIVLILGSGPNVGIKTAQKFTSAGYHVVVTSRTGAAVPSSTAAISIAADFANPSSIHTVFEEVRSKLGEPSVVIYNAVAYTFPPADDPFSAEVSTFASHLVVNAVSAYAAAQEAVLSFKALAAKEGAENKIPKSFIYTGNILNISIMPGALTLGVGKAASAHFVEMGNSSYGPQGYGFYYADERTPEGKSVNQAIDGDAHAEFYYKLANEPKPLGWHQTFVKGKGYAKF